MGTRGWEAHSLSRESKDEFPALKAEKWDTLNLYCDGENSSDPQDLFLGGQQVQVTESDFCGHWWEISHSSRREVTWGPEEETVVVVVVEGTLRILVPVSLGISHAPRPVSLEMWPRVQPSEAPLGESWEGGPEGMGGALSPALQGGWEAGDAIAGPLL